MTHTPNRFFISKFLHIFREPIAASRLVAWVFFCLGGAALLMLSLYYLQIGRNATSSPPSSDFYKFYLSAKRLDQGYSMYWLPPPRERKGDPCHGDTPPDAVHFEHEEASRLNLGGELPCLGPNLNPPVFMLVIRPLSFLPYKTAWWCWAAMSTIAIVIGMWLLTSEHTQVIPWRLGKTLFGCALLFSFFPTLANFTLGQVGGMLFPLLVVSWKNGRKGREGIAGAWLGLCIALKPFLGALLLACLLLKKRRALLSATGVILVLWTLGAVVYGLDAYLDYARTAENITWIATNWNASLQGFLDRLLVSTLGERWIDFRNTAHFVGILIATLLLVISIWRMRKTSTQKRLHPWDGIFSLGLPTALLASPLGWMYYFPMLTLSFAILLDTVKIKWHLSTHRRWLLLVSLSLLLSEIPTVIKHSPTPMQPADWIGVDSIYFYSLLLFWLCAHLALALTRKRAP